VAMGTVKVGLAVDVTVVLVIHLWAGGARRVELKAVHLWVSCCSITRASRVRVTGRRDEAGSVVNQRYCFGLRSGYLTAPSLH
jgi:hypothetical protein